MYMLGEGDTVIGVLIQSPTGKIEIVSWGALALSPECLEDLEVNHQTDEPVIGHTPDDIPLGLSSDACVCVTCGGSGVHPLTPEGYLGSCPTCREE